MRSVSVISILLALAGCAGEGTAAETQPSGTASGSETLDPDVCVAGWEGCPCHEDICIAGLECLSGFCVAVPEPGESSSEVPASTDDTAPASESSTSSDASESSSDDGSSGSSSGGPPPVCVEGDSYCSEYDELQSCVDGQWEFSWCDDWCEARGMGSLNCLDNDVCNCSGFLDDTCTEATSWYCNCHEGCSSAQQTTQYMACFAGDDPVMACWVGIGINSSEQCDAVLATCEP